MWNIPWKRSKHSLSKQLDSQASEPSTFMNYFEEQFTLHETTTSRLKENLVKEDLGTLQHLSTRILRDAVLEIQWISTAHMKVKRITTEEANFQSAFIWNYTECLHFSDEEFVSKDKLATKLARYFTFIYFLKNLDLSRAKFNSWYYSDFHLKEEFEKYFL